jgi:hypothetical protein
VIRATVRAQSAMLDLEAEVKRLESATLREDQAAVETCRTRAHDFLDAYLDGRAKVMTIIANSGG